MKHLPLFTTALTFLLLTACGTHSRPAFERLVGNDRDDHGCIASAGYTYSYALHDCVRLWEVGEPYYAGNRQLYVVYSLDSLYAEVFLSDGKSFICKRKRNTTRWERRKGAEYVEHCNGQSCVSIGKLLYTPDEKK